MNTERDDLERRCPRLGGAVRFSYCRFCGEDRRPCWKILDCWWEYFDVVAHMKEELSGEAFQALVNARPRPKMTSLVELIQQARERTGN